MTSQKKIESNRKNSKKSTGPITEAGKKKVAQNGVKHGLSSKQVVLASEDPEQYEQLLQDLRDDLQPNGRLESCLVEKIAANLWRLNRLVDFDKELFRRWREERCGGFMSLSPPSDDKLALALRYENSIERSMERHLKTLETRQKARKE